MSQFWWFSIRILTLNIPNLHWSHLISFARSRRWSHGAVPWSSLLHTTGQWGQRADRWCCPGLFSPHGLWFDLLVAPNRAGAASTPCGRQRPLDEKGVVADGGRSCTSMLVVKSQTWRNLSLTPELSGNTRWFTNESTCFFPAARLQRSISHLKRANNFHRRFVDY